MHLSAIVAMAQNRCMGRNNQLPWHMPADLKHFKALTLGKPILMGRKTYQSIGKALPDRLNVIMTQDPSFKAPNCTIVHSLDEAHALLKTYDEVMVIGGAKIFEMFLPQINRIYLTLIHESIEGDTYFPALPDKEWRESAREDFNKDEKNPYAYSFITLDRI